jgi:hypothetical protein
MDGREGLHPLPPRKIEKEIESAPNCYSDIFSSKNFTGQLFRYIVVSKVYGIGHRPTPYLR